MVLLEGARVVETALRHDAELLFVVREEGRRPWPTAAQVNPLSDAGTEIVEVPTGGLNEFAATDHPQGILAVAREPRTDLLPPGPVAGRSTSSYTLVLDGVQDPGNAGTLVRAAAALGVGQVLALDGTVDLWSPKAVRASAGLVFGVRIHSLDWARAWDWLAAAQFPLLVAHPQGQDVRDWLRSDGAGQAAHGWALLVGNEAAGPRHEALAVAAAQLSIPLSPGVDSLNVAAAGAILLWVLGPATERKPESLA